MKTGTVGVLGVGATVLVIAAALVQSAGSNPIVGKVLGVDVPAEYRALIEDAGTACPEISPNLLAALIKQESQFNPRADSGPAKGIAQFRPSTWVTHGVDGNGDGKKDMWDPEDAIPAAAQYLCDVAKEVKNVPGDKQANMLAAYNAGPGAVIEHHGVPPYGETRNYVKIIQASAQTPSEGSSGSAGVTAIRAAMGMIGKPYSWGGGTSVGPSTGICCSPNGSSGTNIKGFDCSGLVLYAYARAGISLPRTAAQQYAATEPVRPQDFRAGDLVFFGSSPAGIHHVGIYVGGGRMVNAPRPGEEVRVDDLKSMSDLYAIGRPTPKKEI
ncbi:bifunctional lytic transglycosylase/C40 family peptidase [Streptomyces sp. NPDC001941]|uniref:bifunctional lytic transglycosylase/C40 family peptidase n=1 Tax=Streptomyces sp. NPDC001941 TaxID=3154659 RepID=UPI003324E1FC